MLLDMNWVDLIVEMRKCGNDGSGYAVNDNRVEVTLIVDPLRALLLYLHLIEYFLQELTYGTTTILHNLQLIGEYTLPVGVILIWRNSTVLTV